MSKTNAITINRAEFERLIQRVEDIEDVLQMRSLEERVAGEGIPPGSLPVAAAERILDGESPLRVWREHRGMTLAQLAAASGLGLSYISEIETGKKAGSVQARKKLAQALSTTIDAITL